MQHTFVLKLFLREDEEPLQAIIEVEMDDEEDMFLESTLDLTSSFCPSSSSVATLSDEYPIDYLSIGQWSTIENKE